MCLHPVSTFDTINMQYRNAVSHQMVMFIRFPHTQDFVNEPTQGFFTVAQLSVYLIYLLTVPIL